MKKAFLAAAVLVGLAIACGPARGPPGKSVVVSASTGEIVKNGVYEAAINIAGKIEGEDGGIQFVTVRGQRAQRA